mgnify:CR=1 FL=1
MSHFIDMTLCQWQYDNLSWQYDYDIMSVTKSHGGIVVNVKYQLNKSITFTM